MFIPNMPNFTEDSVRLSPRQSAPVKQQRAPAAAHGVHGRLRTHHRDGILRRVRYRRDASYRLLHLLRKDAAQAATRHASVSARQYKMQHLFGWHPS
jgi:hypothetical protein